MKIRLINKKDGYTIYKMYRGCGYLNCTCSSGIKPAKQRAIWIDIFGRYIRFEILWLK